MTNRILCALALIPACAFAIEKVSFDAPRAYPVGKQTTATLDGPLTAVVAADFNGDGHPDVAVADPGSSAVWVLINSGDGTFLRAKEYATASPAQSVAAGDFNGDGKPDLAVATTNGYAILLNQGNGTFGAAIPYALPSGGVYVAAGDFNGDGKLDLVVVGTSSFNADSTDVSILLGNGDGTFQPPATFTMATDVAALAVGDLNGDGKLDFVVWSFFTHTNPGIWTLLGNGDGTFQSPMQISSQVADWIAIGDFNGDGKPDLAVNSSISVMMFLGKGDGTFREGATYRLPNVYAGTMAAAADFNGDGKLDVVVGSRGGTAILFGKGDGTFQPPIHAGNGVSISLAVADFDGDGRPDLAEAGTRSVAILMGRENGHFPHPQEYAGDVCEQTGFAGIVMADVNGDGIADAIGYSPICGWSVRLGDGHGGFSAAVKSRGGGSPASVAVSDFNGDGKPDLALVAPAGSLSVLLGNGDGTFSADGVYRTGKKAHFVAVGDFNGDGKLDIAVVGGKGPVTILLGKGDGTLQKAGMIALSGDFVGAADFNGDGKADLVVGSSKSVSILLGNGDGTFQPAVSYKADAASVAIADLNGDGKLDIAVTGHGSRFGERHDAGYSILLGNGDGTFAVTHYHLDYAGGAIAVADFNGDGRPDLVMADGALDAIWILTGDGTGKFPAPRRYYSSGFGFSGLAVADVNQDGKPDLVVSGYDTGFTVLLNATHF